MSEETMFSIAILTGGDSRRMGTGKALRELAGKPLLAYVIEAMRPLNGDLFLVGNDIEAYRRFGLPVRGDLHDARSSLVGVHSALAASRHERCLVLPCDMPFADPALVRLMLELSPGYDAVVPAGPAGKEPLFALYTRRCLDTMSEAIERGDFRLLDVLDQLNVRWLQQDEMVGMRDPARTFFNINTPVDLELAEEMLAAALVGDKPAAGEGEAPPLVCFTGRKNSGKTTFIEGLVAHMSGLGYRVACIKHDVHGFSMDHEGTDTYRLAEAGARQVLISSPAQVAKITNVDREISLRELRAEIDGSIDIILAEGFKRSDADRIEVLGDGRSGEPVCAEDELIALIAAVRPRDVSLPVFSHTDVEKVAAFIIGRYALRAAVPEGGRD